MKEGLDDKTLLKLILAYKSVKNQIPFDLSDVSQKKIQYLLVIELNSISFESYDVKIKCDAENNPPDIAYSGVTVADIFWKHYPGHSSSVHSFRMIFFSNQFEKEMNALYRDLAVDGILN